jgi:hypothetical protein
MCSQVGIVEACGPHPALQSFVFLIKKQKKIISFFETQKWTDFCTISGEGGPGGGWG